ncbi:hypothetical protein ACTQ33_05755 [Candidatus Avoscillospira sp. LCP25S3_F1]|uniref:hypothetical protein n=1 Tax=Candidatus Avoscillospira sp. LCP25S3_F1 TaxID=3438825 RepID=UPI003F8DE8DC
MTEQSKPQEQNEELVEQTTAPAEPAKAPLSDEKRTALLRYMAILFGVAFLLVLLTFLIQLRDSKQTISELNKSNASALQNAGKLQDENQALSAANATLEGQLDDLESQVEELEKSKKTLEKTQSQLEQELEKANQKVIDTQTAYVLLAQAKTAASEEDHETLSTVMEQLNPLLDLLTDNDQATVAQLQTQLDEAQ